MAPYYTPLAYKCKGKWKLPAGLVARLRRAMAPAWGAEVVSSNIVGYNKVAVTANSFDILGSQFTAIGDTTIDIQDIVGDGIEEGDNILFFNGAGYDSYTYSSVTFDADRNMLGRPFPSPARRLSPLRASRCS